MIASGVDMIEVSRIDEAILRHGDRFFQRFFTQQELIDSNGRTPALAARFAAKEAAAKALATGIGEGEGKEIESGRGERGEPALRLIGKAEALAVKSGWREWSVSISHTHEHAVAVVVATG